MAQRRPEAVREPRAVGRPGQIVAAPGLAAVDDGERVAVQVADHDLVAMIGERDAPSLRRSAQRDDVADVPRQRARRFALEQLDALLAAAIADRHQRLPVVEPLSHAQPAGVVVAVLAHRAFPQREREQLAARVERDAVPGGMDVERTQMIARRHELARRLRAVRRKLRVDLGCLAARRIEDPQLGAALVGDAAPVGAGVARVEILVIGVARDAAAVGKARVEVAHAVGVGEIPDAVADPHRARDVALELAHAPVRALALGVDPQMAGGAALVSLPARRVGGVAPDEAARARAEGEVIDLPQRQQLRACRLPDRACTRGSCGRTAARRCSRKECGPRASSRARSRPVRAR